jgi:hypothetical protein
VKYPWPKPSIPVCWKRSQPAIRPAPRALSGQRKNRSATNCPKTCGCYVQASTTITDLSGIGASGRDTLSHSLISTGLNPETTTPRSGPEARHHLVVTERVADSRIMSDRMDFEIVCPSDHNQTPAAATSIPFAAAEMLRSLRAQPNRAENPRPMDSLHCRGPHRAVPCLVDVAPVCSLNATPESYNVPDVCQAPAFRSG